MRRLIALSMALSCSVFSTACIDEGDWDDDDELWDEGWGRGGWGNSGWGNGGWGSGSSGGFQATGGFRTSGGFFDDWGYPNTRLFRGGGDIRGRMFGGSRGFLGVPYAAAPVGDLRWKRAQPVAEWEDVREADKFGPRCAQRASTAYGSTSSNSEDCLYMNIWAPEDIDSKGLPVMVYIHGGDHGNGGASGTATYGTDDMTGAYDGSKLAAKGVVVASFNYRLGALGFLAHDALKAEQDTTYGNQGLWDQTAALEWIQDNIEAFGGDPKNVTIFGQGSGAADVCYHMVSNESRGLFQQAISESGGCTTYQRTDRDVAQTTTAWISKLGCDAAGKDVLACLRGKPIDALLNAVPDGENPFGPIVDGDFLTDQPRKLFDGGDVNPAAYILGSNTGEGDLFKALFSTVTGEAGYLGILKSYFPLVPAAELAPNYLNSQYANSQEMYQAALADIFGDARVVCPMLDTAQRAYDAGVDTYVYNFETPALPNGASSHGAELAYVFGSADASQQELTEQVQTYWTNFASNGDPNDGKSLPWDMFSSSKKGRLNLGQEIKVLTDLHEAECKIWNQSYGLQFPGSL